MLQPIWRLVRLVTQLLGTEVLVWSYHQCMRDLNDYRYTLFSAEMGRCCLQVSKAGCCTVTATLEALIIRKDKRTCVSISRTMLRKSWQGCTIDLWSRFLGLLNDRSLSWTRRENRLKGCRTLDANVAWRTRFRWFNLGVQPAKPS